VITYTFAATDTATQWTWYWVADIDEACFETQTMPTSVKDFQKPAIAAIIKKHIFETASKVTLEQAPNRGANNRRAGNARGNVAQAEPEQPRGLRPDPTVTGGGGHLSFDASTAFGDAQGRISLEVMLSTLEHLQNTADDLSRRFRTGTDDKPLKQANEQGTGQENVPADFQNAPSLDTQKLKGTTTDLPMKQYTALVTSIQDQVKRGDVVTLTKIKNDLVEFNQKLTNPKVVQGARKQHLEDPENISHYQAINIEHLAEPTASERRVEVRDVPAQTDYDKFLQDLGHLVDEIKAAREVVRSEQKGRLG
jgi:hypothetical protein